MSAPFYFSTSLTNVNKLLCNIFFSIDYELDKVRHAAWKVVVLPTYKVDILGFASLT